jgi:uncharacterized RDD family membrane protein YckC
VDNPYAPPAAPVQDIVGVIDERVPADRLIRLGASILDGIIFGALVYLPFFFGLLMMSSAGSESRGVGLAIAVMIGLAGLVIWSWFTIRYVRANGQSIAKRMLGIKVVRSNGEPASLGRIFLLRNLVNAVIGAIPFVGIVYGIVDVLFIFSDTRQCLHDKIADTIVIVA